MEFIKGADVSSLQAMEDYGAKFYDFDGNEADALAILQGHGVNYIRLRLFHQPTRSFDGGDYCDLPHTVLMAKRIKARGLGFLLDFHYSDFWADWKAQTIPVQWQGMSADELEHQVYAYTCEVLQTLTDAGAAPDMVQIGNEIGKGMLWEYGSLKHPRQLAIFLNAGLSAVRAVCEKNRLQMRTVLHVECGADMPRTEQFLPNYLPVDCIRLTRLDCRIIRFGRDLMNNCASTWKTLSINFTSQLLLWKQRFPIQTPPTMKCQTL